MTVFTELPNVAAERLGGRVLLANDEFFAPKENLLKASKPVWREDEYTDRGKWMDGWETRRRRTPGHDWCIVRLGIPSIVRGIMVDTAFFRGNYPEHCSLEACAVAEDATAEAMATSDSGWIEVLPRSALRGDAENPFAVAYSDRVTHLRFNIYPDGGVARLRVFGEPLASAGAPGAVIDLAAVTNGGLVLACSDMFFGNRHNLILPGRSTHMGDGWETKRRRGPGHDWIVVRLAGRGTIRRIEVDTDHFKGNAPESCAVDTRDGDDAEWTELLPRTGLQPHSQHGFDVKSSGAATHARLAIYPDGGIARLRLFGTLAK
jgi:allantoicase